MDTANAQVEFRPLGEDDPRVNRAAVVELLTDFLLNETAQADDVSIAIIHACAKQAVDNLVVLAEKQHDYGPGNISSFGEVGVLVRASDKVARLRNLMGRVAKNEAIGDSWLDIANYGVIAQVVRSGKWPGCEKRHALSHATN